MGKPKGQHEVPPKNVIDSMRQKLELKTKVYTAQKDAKMAYQLAQDIKAKARQQYETADWNSWFASSQIEKAR
jgi:hypothetical protein